MIKFTPKLLVGFVLALSATCCLKAQNLGEKEILPLLQKNIAVIGITNQDLNDAIFTDNYTDADTKITHVYLQQSYRQVRVLNKIITATIRDNKLEYSTGNYVKDISLKAGSSAVTCFLPKRNMP